MATSLDLLAAAKFARKMHGDMAASILKASSLLLAIERCGQTCQIEDHSIRKPNHFGLSDVRRVIDIKLVAR
jgi:hypothetical protein